MYILNFSHPITQSQIEQIEQLLSPVKVDKVINYRIAFDPNESFYNQLTTFWEQQPFLMDELENASFLVNLPAHNVIAALLLSHFHGLMGFFPTVIRLKVNGELTPTTFELAEIINLQNVREKARLFRKY
jgi:hypothetical protein